MQSNDVGPAPEARLFASEHEPEMELVHLRPEEIEVRHNPRRATPTPELHRLARTIAQAGLLQPLAVSRDGDRYVLVAGERRLEACKLIRSERIPCVVRRDDDPALRRVRALAENVARASLDPMEEAAELVAITDELGLSSRRPRRRSGSVPRRRGIDGCHCWSCRARCGPRCTGARSGSSRR